MTSYQARLLFRILLFLIWNAGASRWCGDFHYNKTDVSTLFEAVKKEAYPSL